MLFNSLEFFVFFGVVYTLYLLLPMRGQNTLLLLAGYVFYGWWDVRFLFLIAFSTTVDFWIGLMLAEGRVPARQRAIASGFICFAAFAFLLVDWQLLFTVRGLDMADAIRKADPVAWSALASSVLFVLVANLTHDPVARMSAEQRNKLMLFVTVFVNLTFLGIFKYFNFFIDSAAVALSTLGWNASLFHLHIVLPVGISFYTFQSLSYTIDVSRGLVKPTRRLQDFALFVAYFPPMVAGPIERARHLLPQLLATRRIRIKHISQGLWLILFGLFKKVGIADGLAVSVNAVFNSSGAVSTADVYLATALFAVQIFCDFSGYTDIARGISKLLGIELMINFNLPYFSKNPSEFWRRWHISLSSWLRDYLYVSLGGNRKGAARTYFNLFATMTLGGLWHGAAWNFVLWGVYQGALLGLHRFFTTGSFSDRKEPEAKESKWIGAIKIIFFMAFVCYGWLLFRANSLDQIIIFSQSLLGLGTAYVPSVLPRPAIGSLLGLMLLATLQIAEYLDGRMEVVRFWPRPVQAAVLTLVLIVLVMGTSNVPVQFIYFQF